MKKTNNPNGRPKGSKNKVTKELREWVQCFLEGKQHELEREWKKLEPRDKFMLFEKLLTYSLPKLQATEFKGSINTDKMTDEQLELVIQKLTKEK